MQRNGSAAVLEDSIVKSINRLHARIIAVSSTSGRIMGYVGGYRLGFSQMDNVTTPEAGGVHLKPHYLIGQPCKRERSLGKLL